MKTVGIIAEYNPFHNGHEYLIKKARELTGADFVVVIMSGDFTERGEPAVFDKFTRTAAALSCGADIVLELPAVYATGSSEFFAFGAVKMLNAFGVNYLCFGTEAEDFTCVRRASEILSCLSVRREDSEALSGFSARNADSEAPADFSASSPDSEAFSGISAGQEASEYNRVIRLFLSEGLSYPAAREKALRTVLPDNSEKEGILSVLSSPNNILAIDYLRALRQLNSAITPVPVFRIGEGYHSDSITSLASASGIRNKILEASHSSSPEALEELKVVLQGVMPSNAVKVLFNQEKLYPVFPEDLSPLINYRLSLETSESLSNYLDFSEDLANSVKKYCDHPVLRSEILKVCSGKNITTSRVSRALIHLLLNITAKDAEIFHRPDFIPYIRILGLRRGCTAPVRGSSVYTFTSPAEAKASVGSSPAANCTAGIVSAAAKMLETDLLSHEIYDQILFTKYGLTNKNEARLKLPVII